MDGDPQFNPDKEHTLPQYAELMTLLILHLGYADKWVEDIYKPFAHTLQSERHSEQTIFEILTDQVEGMPKDKRPKLEKLPELFEAIDKFNVPPPAA